MDSPVPAEIEALLSRRRHQTQPPGHPAGPSGPHDDNDYVVSHIEWGTEHRAQRYAIGTRFPEFGGVMDAESFYGNMEIAFGSNCSRFMHVTNKSGFHLDLPTRNHSILVDDRLVVDRGVIVPDDLK